MRTEMTPLERELAAELKKALALRDDAELILNLDATTKVSANDVTGAALSVSTAGASPMRMFAPAGLLASVLAKSFAAWGPEYLAKLKPHQK